MTNTDRLLDEGLISVVDAAAAESITISSKTALRWSLSGVRGVRLETVKVAGRRLTSRAAFRRFVAAQNVPKGGAAPGLDHDAAERVLRAFGLGREDTST